MWPVKSWWLLLRRSLRSVRWLSLRSLPPTPLALQLLLVTGFVGSLHSRDDGKLLNITLKDFLIQDPSTEDDHAPGVQYWTGAPGEGSSDSLLTVNYEGDRLALHSHSHTVPLAIRQAEASEDRLSRRLRPPSLVLVQEADRSAELQAQLPDALGTVEGQEGRLEARAGPDRSQQREIFGKASWKELTGGCTELGGSGHSVGHISWTDTSCPPDTVREGGEPQGPKHVHGGCACPGGGGAQPQQ